MRWIRKALNGQANRRKNQLASFYQWVSIYIMFNFLNTLDFASIEIDKHRIKIIKDTMNSVIKFISFRQWNNIMIVHIFNNF